MPTPVQPSRRAVVAGLASVAGLTLAGCTSDGDLPDLPGLPDDDVAADPDRSLARRVRRDENDVLLLVEATREKHRELRSRLRDTLRSHEEHVEQLTPSSTGQSGEGAVLPSVPKNPTRALADVVTAEQDLARRHAASALKADSGPLARVIASMSAAAAQQGSGLASGAEQS